MVLGGCHSVAMLRFQRFWVIFFTPQKVGKRSNLILTNIIINIFLMDWNGQIRWVPVWGYSGPWSTSFYLEAPGSTKLCYPSIPFFLSDLLTTDLHYGKVLPYFWWLKWCSSCGGWLYPLADAILRTKLGIRKWGHGDMILHRTSGKGRGDPAIANHGESPFVRVIPGNHPKHGQMFVQFLEFKLDLPWLT